MVESRNKDIRLVSYLACIDIVAQVYLTMLSIFLFLYVPTLKFGIIVILPTNQPEIILSTARTTKN